MKAYFQHIHLALILLCFFALPLHAQKNKDKNHYNELGEKQGYWEETQQEEIDSKQLVLFKPSSGLYVNGKREGEWHVTDVKYRLKNNSDKYGEAYLPYRNGVLNGTVRIGYTKNGVFILLEQIEFKEGKHSGPQIIYRYQSDNIATDVKLNNRFYNEGTLLYVVNYWPNGFIIDSTNYVPYGREGKTVGYNMNGTISFKGEYLKNQKEGTWYDYDGLGNLKDSLHYVDGKLEGLCRFYDQISYWSVMYRAGLPDGWQLSYYRNGNIKDSLYWELGKKEGTELAYYPDGSLEYNKQWHKGWLQAEKSYTKEGELCRQVNYKDPDPDGYYYTKDSSGRVTEGYYADRRKQGSWTENNQQVYYDEKQKVFYDGLAIQSEYYDGGRFKRAYLIDLNYKRVSGYYNNLEFLKIDGQVKLIRADKLDTLSDGKTTVSSGVMDLHQRIVIPFIYSRTWLDLNRQVLICVKEEKNDRVKWEQRYLFLYDTSFVASLNYYDSNTGVVGQGIKYFKTPAMGFHLNAEEVLNGMFGSSGPPLFRFEMKRNKIAGFYGGLSKDGMVYIPPQFKTKKEAEKVIGAANMKSYLDGVQYVFLK